MSNVKKAEKPTCCVSQEHCWVVVGEYVDYSDSRFWLVSCHHDEAEAKEAAAALGRLAAGVTLDALEAAQDPETNEWLGVDPGDIEAARRLLGADPQAAGTYGYGIEATYRVDRVPVGLRIAGKELR